MSKRYLTFCIKISVNIGFLLFLLFILFPQKASAQAVVNFSLVILPPIYEVEIDSEIENIEASINKASENSNIEEMKEPEVILKTNIKQNNNYVNLVKRVLCVNIEATTPVLNQSRNPSDVLNDSYLCNQSFFEYIRAGPR